MSTSTIRISEIPEKLTIDENDFALALTSEGTRRIKLTRAKGVEDVTENTKYYVRHNGGWSATPTWEDVLISNSPTNNNHSTNKLYVDTSIANAVLGRTLRFDSTSDFENHVNGGSNVADGTTIHITNTTDDNRGSWISTKELSGPGFTVATAIQTGDIVSINTGISEAPVDAFSYARGNSTWTNSPSFNSITVGQTNVVLEPSNGSSFDVATKTGTTLFDITNGNTDGAPAPAMSLKVSNNILLFQSSSGDHSVIRAASTNKELRFRVADNQDKLVIKATGDVWYKDVIWSDTKRAMTISANDAVIDLDSPHIEVTIGSSHTAQFAGGKPGYEYTITVVNSGLHTLTLNNVNIIPIFSYNATDMLTIRVVDSKYIVTNHIKKI